MNLSSCTSTSTSATPPRPCFSFILFYLQYNMTKYIANLMLLLNDDYYDFRFQKAAQALAKILISTDPTSLKNYYIFDAISVLLKLCDAQDNLLQFEALMALTNISSTGDEAKRHLLKKKAPQTFECVFVWLNFPAHHHPDHRLTYLRTTPPPSPSLSLPLRRTGTCSARSMRWCDAPQPRLCATCARCPKWCLAS